MQQLHIALNMWQWQPSIMRWRSTFGLSDRPQNTVEVLLMTFQGDQVLGDKSFYLALGGCFPFGPKLWGGEKTLVKFLYEAFLLRAFCRPSWEPALTSWVSKTGWFLYLPLNDSSWCLALHRQDVSSEQICEHFKCCHCFNAGFGGYLSKTKELKLLF